MGIDCLLVLTYNPKLARKQEHTLHNGIKKLKRQVREKWGGYKLPPRTVPKSVLTLIKDSRYGAFITISCKDGQPVFGSDESTLKAMETRRKRFGKNLLFSSDLQAQAGWVIEQYRAKDRIEDDFKLLKDPEGIRWSPSRHWTDTKIRAFAFCCVMALLLVRVMEIKATQAGLRMSPAVLKEELCDLKEILLLYDTRATHTQVSARSSVQQRLWNLFGLGSPEKQLTGH